MMIGLRKGTVQVVPHQPRWHDLFEQERRVLHEHIGPHVLDIQHVGSTSVPGLDAKPIIDIAVAVASLAVMADCRRQLVRLGYIDRGDAGSQGGLLFVRERAPEVRTHHLHIVAIDDPQWRNYLAVRDTLRADDLLRVGYAELKKSLQVQFAHDSRAYTEAKTDFIRRVLSGG